MELVAVVVAIAAVFGLVVGSFLNVVVYRVPAGLSVVAPRSRCPACETEIAARDNVPVLSWLLLRGRCRSCGQSISSRYPLVELACAVLFAACAVRFGADPALPAFCVWSAGLLALSLIDLDHFLLPKKVLYPASFATGGLLVVAAAVDGRWGSLRSAAIATAACAAVIFVIHFVYPAGMAFGDVRLAGMIGLAAGWISVAHAALGIFIGFLLASVIGVALIATGRKSRKDPIPFGPFLAAGGVLAVLVGDPIVSWYGL